MLAWLNGLIGAVVAPVISAILNSVFGALRTKRLDHENVATHERAAKAEAESETREIIAEIADERSKVDVGDDADAIAARLRNRKQTGARNFGNPGKADTR